MFDIVDTPFSYGRVIDCLLITSGIFQDKRYSACDLKCRYCVFTFGGRTLATILCM